MHVEGNEANTNFACCPFVSGFADKGGCCTRSKFVVRKADADGKAIPACIFK